MEAYHGDRHAAEIHRLEARRKSLLKRFLTRKTRLLILRRSAGSPPPTAEWILGYMIHTSFWEYRWSDVEKEMESVLADYSMDYSFAANLGLPVPEHEPMRDVVLTLQNVHLCVNSLRRVPYFVTAIHLENATMRCHVSTGTYPVRSPPQVVLEVAVEKAIIVPENGSWPCATGDPVEAVPLQALAFFGRFLPAALSAAEEEFIREQLQSDDPVGAHTALVSYLRRWVQLPFLTPVMPLGSLGLTLNNVLAFPIWLRQLVLELLKDPSIGTVPIANTRIDYSLSM
ncbi:uncharacterized protein LOC129597024 [Paramacrobiotus metropolitanus]|uniref:uncharacterized protein LOC129597024 n=1 Tax=Paramacrobiotus metropolitanus TaxID=2943436 RepID=UPI002445B085|nr:uncharacterized protein LOC129597024 [Paramacrobiotus metropolitanus]